MSKTTFKHMTPDGVIHTRTTAADYRYVKVARWTRRDGTVSYTLNSWSGKCAGTVGKLYYWGFYAAINNGNMEGR